MSHLAPGLTIHFRIRNEENFVRAAILSVLPLAERIMVYDTGSTDRTLKEVQSIRDKKIELVCKGPMSPKELDEQADYRGRNNKHYRKRQILQSLPLSAEADQTHPNSNTE